MNKKEFFSFLGFIFGVIGVGWAITKADMWNLLKSASSQSEFMIYFSPGDWERIIRNWIFFLVIAMLLFAAKKQMSVIRKIIFFVLVYIIEFGFLYIIKQKFYLFESNFFQVELAMNMGRFVFQGWLVQCSMLLVFMAWIRFVWYLPVAVGIIVTAVFLQSPSIDYIVLGFKFVQSLCKNPILMGIIFLPIIARWIYNQLYLTEKNVSPRYNWNPPSGS